MERLFSFILYRNRKGRKHYLHLGGNWTTELEDYGTVEKIPKPKFL